MIQKNKVSKISKIYFQNVSGDGQYSQAASDNLANHFVHQLIKGAQETQEYDGELYE